MGLLGGQGGALNIKKKFFCVGSCKNLEQCFLSCILGVTPNCESSRNIFKAIFHRLPQEGPSSRRSWVAEITRDPVGLNTECLRGSMNGHRKSETGSPKYSLAMKSKLAPIRNILLVLTLIILLLQGS